MGGVNFLSFPLRGFRVRRAAALASLMVVVFLAGGCATENEGGGEQSPSPTNQETSAEPEATPEPEGTPTVVEVEPPVKPEAMSSDGEGGAVAALEYFFDVLSYSFATRDTTILDDISYEQCSFCANINAEIEAMSNTEENYRNVIWKLDEVLSVDVDREVAFTIKGAFTVTTKFDEEKTDGVVTTDGIFTVGYKNGEWELIEVSKP